MRLYRNQGMERQYHNEVVGFNTRMTDIHAAIGRVQLTKVAGWTAQRQAERGLPDGQPRGRHDAPGRRRGRARLPPVHGARARRPRRVRRRAARGVRRRLGHVLPGPQPPAAAVPASTSTCPRPSWPPRSACRCRCTPRSARTTSSGSSRPSTPSPGRVPDGEPARGPDRPRDDGSSPRPRARQPRRASTSSPSPTRVATCTACRAGGRSRPTSRRSSRTASTTAWSRCRPTSTRRSAWPWPRPACTP